MRFLPRLLTILCLLILTHGLQAQQLSNSQLNEVINRAEKILESGKPGKALNELKPYLKQLQQSNRGYILVGRALAEKGDMQSASKLFASMHQAKPRNVEALQWLAYSQAELKQYEASNQTFVKLLKLQGDTAYTHASVCINLYKSNKYTEAVKACTRAINIDAAGSDAAYAYRAASYIQLGKDLRSDKQLAFVKQYAADCNKAKSYQEFCRKALKSLKGSYIKSTSATMRDGLRQAIEEDARLSDNEKAAYGKTLEFWEKLEPYLLSLKTLFSFLWVFGLITLLASPFIVFLWSRVSEAKTPGLENPFKYLGRKSTLFGIWLKNLMLNILTLGIYRFWGITHIRHYMWGQTSLQNVPFEYHGTGKEIFKGFLKIMVVLLLFAVAPEIARFIVQDFWISAAIGALISLAYLFLWYMIIYAATRYRLSRTTWQGIRFMLHGKAKVYGSRRFLALLGKIFSLGIFAPQLDLWCYRYIATTLSYGSIRAHLQDFDKRQYGALKRSNMLTYLFALPTLGLSRLWYKARLIRFRLGHTAFENVQLTATHTGSGLAWLWISNIILVVVTLGFATPVAMHRAIKYQTSHIGIVGDIDGLLAEQIKGKAGSAAEGFEDGFDGADFGAFA